MIQALLVISILLTPRIIVTGDSIARGFGDIVDGGYVTRTQNSMPEYKFINQGISGITTVGLYRWYVNEINRSSRFKLKLKTASLIFIDVGRNDYWTSQSPITTVNNIFLLRRLFRKYSNAKVYIACLLPVSRRPGQDIFVKAVNSRICNSGSLRFDTVPRKYLNLYGVHPLPAGYNYMSIMLKKYIKGRFHG